MRNLIYIELYKLFSSNRTYISFAIVIILMLIVDLGLYSDGNNLFNFLLQSINDYFFIEGNLLNGYLIAYLSLNTLWVHIPILIIIVTTYIFSSEFEFGTIRVLLTQPIPRQKLLSAKIFSMIAFNVCFMLVVAIFAIFPARFIFGKGDIVVFIDGIQFIQESSFFKRYIATILFAIIAMLAYSSMAMYFAIKLKNTLSAILVSFGILIVFTLVQSFVFGMLSWCQPFLFTYHFSKWQLFFTHDVPIYSLLNSVIFLVGMSGFFILLSFYEFNKTSISQ